MESQPSSYLTEYHRIKEEVLLHTLHSSVAVLCLAGRV